MKKRMNDGWFKLHYKITEWGWFQDARTLQVFIYLLARATIKKTEFMGIAIKRGQVVTSYASIARAINCSMQEARTAINHLKSTGEITSKAYPKFSVITIEKYDLYQDSNKQSNSQLTSNQQASHKQLTTLKDSKKVRKKESKNISRTRAREEKEKPEIATEGYLPYGWELSIPVPKEYWGRFETEDDWWAFARKREEEEPGTEVSDELSAEAE